MTDEETRQLKTHIARLHRQTARLNLYVSTTYHMDFKRIDSELNRIRHQLRTLMQSSSQIQIKGKL